jgi:hypothetical protein
MKATCAFCGRRIDVQHASGRLADHRKKCGRVCAGSNVDPAEYPAEPTRREPPPIHVVNGGLPS